MKIKFGKELIEIDISNLHTIHDLKQIVLFNQSNLDESTMKFIAYGHILSDDHILDTIPGGNNSKITLIASSTNVPNNHIVSNIPSRTKIIDDLNLDDSKDHSTKYRYQQSNHSSKKEISKYRFESIETLPGLIMEDKARSILESLANDVGILAVLNKHKWKVDSLCELYPEGYVGVSDTCLMGLNKNHGEKILLRIRTDDMKGFRNLLSIKKVLCHELAHNVYGDHDDNFYILMRQIERDIIELDWRNSKAYTITKKTISNQYIPSTSNNTYSNHSSTESNPNILGGSLDPLIQSFLPGKYLAGTAAMLRDNAITVDSTITNTATTTNMNNNNNNNTNDNINNNINDNINNNINNNTNDNINNNINDNMNNNMNIDINDNINDINSDDRFNTNTHSNSEDHQINTVTINNTDENISLGQETTLYPGIENSSHIIISLEIDEHNSILERFPENNNILGISLNSNERYNHQQELEVIEMKTENNDLIQSDNSIQQHDEVKVTISEINNLNNYKNADIDLIYDSMISHIDEVLLNAFSTDASETIVNKLLLLKDSIQTIISSIKTNYSNNIMDMLHKIFKLLYKICYNIVQHPNDNKYHRINTNTSLYQTILSQVYGILDFLKILGFHFQDSNKISLIVTSPDPALMYVISSILQVFNDILNN